MSSVWGKLAAVAAAGDAAKFRKCSCDRSGHAAWTLHPAKEELSHGAPPIQGLQQVFRVLSSHADEAIRMIEASGQGPRQKPGYQQNLRQSVEHVSVLLEKNASYRVPHSAEEERRRFRQDIRQLMKPLTKFPGTTPHLWPGHVARMERGAPTDAMERLIWHHDPRLQLIHYPSFRLFIEVQLLLRSLRVAVRTYEEHQPSSDAALFSIMALMMGHVSCVAFYATKLEEAEAGRDLSEPAPATPTPTAAEEAEGPSLSKAQRKRAQQKANKAATRLAKDTAAGPSRSDFLPKTPAPKHPVATKKKNKSPRGSETAAAKSSPGEPAKESPEPSMEAENAAASEASARAPPPAEALEASAVAAVASVAPLAVPLAEAVVPSGAYAVLAHDLARIADRLRQARLARSAH